MGYGDSRNQGRYFVPGDPGSSDKVAGHF